MTITGRESAKRTNPEPESQMIRDYSGRQNGEIVVVSRVGERAYDANSGQVGIQADPLRLMKRKQKPKGRVVLRGSVWWRSEPR